MQSFMDWETLLETWEFMDILMLIGLEMLMTRRSHLGATLSWGLPWFLEWVRRKSKFLRWRVVIKIFKELFEIFLEMTVIYCDNQSGIRLLENHVLKYIEIINHYIRDIALRGEVRLQHISSDEHVARIFYKPFILFKDQLGMMDVTLSRRDHYR